MANIKLTAAGQVENERIEAFKAEERPMFHLTPYCGWMSDSNGFSFYKGEYHLFYQYNLCESRGDKAHWGHGVSKTLLDWKHVPAETVRDSLCDEDCCDQSGELPIPKDLIRSGSRDFKIIKEDERYLALVACRSMDGSGQILLYESSDGSFWKYWKTLIKNDGRSGTMWECPDFFELDGTRILLVSPIEMKSHGMEDRNVCGATAICGEYDSESGAFTPVWNQSIDYGIDFYLPQTLLTPDGRRVMIAGMQKRNTDAMMENHAPWAGQMTLPRELYVKDGRLCQTPVRELQQYYTNVITYNKVPVSDEVFLYGMESRCTDLEITVRPVPGESCYREFAVWLAMDDENHSTVSYTPENGMVKIGREHSGSRKQVMYQCGCLVKESMDGNIKIRIILDKFSLEVFINDGRYVMSSAISTSPSAERIAFHAEGRALIDVTKRDIRI